MSKALAELWAEMWATPQAIAWEELGWTRVVARYCRKLLDAEKPDSSTGLLSEVRQLEDRLGLTPMAMKRLMWETYDPPSAGAEEGDTGDGPGDGKVIDLDDHRALYS